jgi:hypothetical protein
LSFSPLSNNRSSTHALGSGFFRAFLKKAQIFTPGILYTIFVLIHQDDSNIFKGGYHHKNFMNSKILGLPTYSDWGVVFERVDSLPRHPVQLYESLAYLWIFVLLVLFASM